MTSLIRYIRKFRTLAGAVLPVSDSMESSIDSCVRTYWSPTAAHRFANAEGSNHPLRILFVAPKDDYGLPQRGLSIEENYFFHALYSMGHEVVRFDFMSIMKRHGRRTMNEMLSEAVYRYDPDVMFAVLFKDELDQTRIREISDRERPITVNWFCDDHWRFDNFSRYWAPCFNWVVTTAKSALPKYAAFGISNVILSQWACNQHLYYPMNLPRVYDVTFVGQPHGNRRSIIDSLRRAGLSVMVWGQGWGTGRISQSEMVRIINQSRINLNLSNASADLGLQIKGRNFEIPGCGGFLLTDKAENLDEYYDIGHEIVCFDDVDDLVSKAKYYLANEHERDLVAGAGYQRTIRDHTIDLRFSRIFGGMGLVSEAKTKSMFDRLASAECRPSANP